MCHVEETIHFSLRVTFLLGKEEKTGPVGEAVVREGLLKEA